MIVRQKYPIRRLSGVRVAFEDNAGVLVTPEGEIKGTDIKGPVAKGGRKVAKNSELGKYDNISEDYGRY